MRADKFSEQDSCSCLLEFSCSFALQDGSFSLAHMLSGHPGITNARFGFAMAAVGDLNQDGLTDVAIGAPLEGLGTEDSVTFGTVYIYNGREDGLFPNPSQVNQLPLVSDLSNVSQLLS